MFSRKFFHLPFILFFLTMGQTAIAQDVIPLILFDGIVLDDSGQPVSGAQVQFWQTDPNGYYDHPAEPNTALRDLSFQFYGTATTAEDGSFSFTTYRPGEYEPRPTHIHFKVWLNGTELLTSQLYFADENAGQPDSLTLDLVEGTDGSGEPAMLTSKTIVVNMGGDGSQTVTPSQQEGPFYPVVNFFGYDNDLTTLEPIPLILFDGIVLDDSGQPVSEAQVQFWQTDLDGYYDHPLAPNTALRDLSFQFYGTATTADDGSFTFKTYRPGLYPGRPGHIHFKVWLNGTELLTSQLYFADENAGQPDSLTLDLVEGLDESNVPAMLTSKTVVVNMDGDGSQTVTPSQAEGPFYPVVDFFELDTDLTVLDAVPTAVQMTNTTAIMPNLLILVTAVLIMSVVTKSLLYSFSGFYKAYAPYTVCVKIHK